MHWIIRSFDEHSILWVLISTGIGTVIGALSKLLFDELLSTRLKAARTAKAAIRKYSLPLLESAYNLDRRISNLTRFIDKKWFEDVSDDYYRLSTLYLFGCYFGWCKILENDGVFGLDTSERRTKDFNHFYHRVFKGMTGFIYFEGQAISEADIEGATVPRLALTAIGELMIREGDKEAKKPAVLGFVDFTNRYSTSDEFQKWFGYLDRLLRGVTRERQDLKWNRILVFGSNLRVFVSFLDPHANLTSKHTIDWLGLMDPGVAERLRKEILEAGFEDLLEGDGRKSRGIARQAAP